MPRAIVFNGDETWELREVPKPRLRPGCAVLRVEAVGICHSDVDQFRGHAPVPSGGVFPTPTIWSLCRALRCGSSATICRRPSSPSTSACPTRRPSYAPRNPGSHCSSWARATWASPPSSPPERRALARSSPSVCHVTGCASRPRSASEPDHAVDLEGEDPVDRVAEATGGRMADVVLDVASGSARSFITAFELVRPGGKVVAAGMKDRPMDGFDINQIPLRNITVLPGGGVDLTLACSMINEGKVPTAELAGESFPLERFEEALALADRRVEGKDAVRVSLEVA